MDKICEIDELKHRIRQYQHNGKKVVVCYGIFDVLHIGHIRYLKQAEQLGDVTMVVLVSDEFLLPQDKIEHNESIRAETLAHLDWIDSISINTFGDWETMIRELRPDVYARGFESVQGTEHDAQSYLKALCKEIDVTYVVVREDTFSSTAQINRYIADFSKEVQEYIRLFKKRFFMDQVIEPLDRLEKLKVLLIGDTILDEYYFCSVIGKSSKDPTLALKFESRDLFGGGVLAVANHMANFVNRVDLVTVLGERDSQEDYIRSMLKPNVFPVFLYKQDAPTTIKRRFIDGYSTNKLFEIYIMDDSELNAKQSEDLDRILLEKLGKRDLVVIADYGHGALGRESISRLTKQAAYLAVNTQSNAGNRGFNTISKYRRADFATMAEHEIRLETRDLRGQLFPMMKKLAARLSCRQLIVTRGKKGCMLLDNLGGLIQVPSFAKTVVDRVGAGDAFFSVTALMNYLNIPEEILGFIGNVAGSLAVETMGNQKSIEKNRIKEFIFQLLS